MNVTMSLSIVIIKINTFRAIGYDKRCTAVPSLYFRYKYCELMHRSNVIQIMTAKVNLSVCTEDQSVSEEEITPVTALSSKNISMNSPNVIDNTLYGIVMHNEPLFG